MVHISRYLIYVFVGLIEEVVPIGALLCTYTYKSFHLCQSWQYISNLHIDQKKYFHYVLNKHIINNLILN